MSTTVGLQELIDSTAAPVETLEKRADSDEIALLQCNDRASRHRHPKLDDRGDAYEASPRNDGVVTVIREA